MIEQLRSDTAQLQADPARLAQARLDGLEFSQSRFVKYHSADLGMKRVIRRTFNKHSLAFDTVELVGWSHAGHLRASEGCGARPARDAPAAL